MAFSLFSSSSKRRSYLLIDIGPGSVGVASVSSVEKKDGTSVAIHFTNRTDIVTPADMSFETYLAAANAALAASLDVFVKTGLPIPRDARVMLDTPWQVNQTRMITLERPNPFVVTHRMLTDLIKRETHACGNDIQERGLLPSGATRVIEQGAMRFSQNGYDVESPVGKRARSLEASLFVAVAPQAACESFSRTIAEHIVHATTAFHSAPFAKYVILRDIFAEMKNFLVVDVSGELTALHFIENDTLLESLSFPSGTHTLEGMAREAFGTTRDETASYLRMYAEGTLGMSEREKLDRVYSLLKQSWSDYFGKALSSLSKSVIVPDAIFIIAPPGDRLWVMDGIKSESLHEYKIASQSFAPVYVGEPIVADHVTRESGTLYDAPLFLEALYTGLHFRV